MKRKNIKKLFYLIVTALLLSGCRASGSTETESEGSAAEEAAQVPTEDILAGIKVYAPGPYGKISLILPGDWVYQPYTSGSENSNSGSYGMWIRPADQDTGYIDVCYMQSFGVCGTGLVQETLTLAGDEASAGTYDDHTMWDFIAFHGKNEGLTAQNVMAESWPSYEQEKAFSILDTLHFDPEETQGAVSYFKNDSEIPEIGLIAEGHNVTSSGLTIRFSVWDPDLTQGDLEFSEAYQLEKLEENEWKALPVIIEGDWGFNDEAIAVSKDPNSPETDWEVNWEWLYGKLSPGDYRISKNIIYYRGTGDYSTYPVYVYFRNGGEIREIQKADGEWISPAE